MREVAYYVEALTYGLEQLEKLPVSLRLLREIHRRLMKGVRGEKAYPGEFRRSQNWIGPPGCTLAEARFVPPPVPEMHEALDALEKYLHEGDSYPPLVRLAFVHYQFEAIHPFVDGNGRMGRLLVALLLADWKMLSQPLLYLSAYFERHRSTYYDLLLAVSEEGAWRDWVMFFLRGVLEQSREAGTKIKMLQDLHRSWHEALTASCAPASAIRLLEYLFVQPVITIRSVERLLDAAYHTAKGAVERLAREGILFPMGNKHRNTVYLARGVLEVISSR